MKKTVYKKYKSYENKPCNNKTKHYEDPYEKNYKNLTTMINLGKKEKPPCLLSKKRKAKELDI